MDELSEVDAYERKAKLAYELWERRGCPFGSPEVDWIAAEAILASEQEPERSTAAAAGD
jgi:DUF2934 family protein